MLMLTLALSLFVAIGHGQGTPACDLDQEALMKTAMECVAHDPKLMMEIIEHLKNPDEMANMKFVCSNQRDLVDVAICMERKLVVCLPQEVRPMVLELVSQDRLEAVLKFACQHQAELLDPCLDDETSLQLGMCVRNESTMLTAFAYPQLNKLRMQDVLCGFSLVFKKCLAANHGTCSKAYTDVYDEMFELMFSEHHCDGNQMGAKNALTSNLLGSLLLRGQPMGSKLAEKYGSSILRFEPSGKNRRNY